MAASPAPVSVVAKLKRVRRRKNALWALGKNLGNTPTTPATTASPGKLMRSGDGQNTSTGARHQKEVNYQIAEGTKHRPELARHRNNTKIDSDTCIEFIKFHFSLRASQPLEATALEPSIVEVTVPIFRIFIKFSALTEIRTKQSYSGDGTCFQGRDDGSDSRVYDLFD